MSIECLTIDATFRAIQEKLSRVMPDFEIQQEAELVLAINPLKRERGAIILDHNYMEPVLYQTIPDVVGNSPALAKITSQTDQDLIVFCGVRFMAETAKILSPKKTVLLPTPLSGCSLAESITVDDVRWLRDHFPGVPVVTYINTCANVKAEPDIYSTSSNAPAVVDSLKSDTAILIPDEYLAQDIANMTGKEIIRLCSIRCPYMNEITLEQTLASPELRRFEIELPASLIARARKPIEAMMRVS